MRRAFRKRFVGGSSRNKAAGFSLVELITVMAIIGVLAAIAIPAYFSYINTAKITLAYGTLDTIRKNFESFHIDFKRYPTGDIAIFDTGKDDQGQTVFTDMFLEQIDHDLDSIVSYNYNSATDIYELKVRANDGDKTAMTLTPQDISY